MSFSYHQTNPVSHLEWTSYPEIRDKVVKFLNILICAPVEPSIPLSIRLKSTKRVTNGTIMVPVPETKRISTSSVPIKNVRREEILLRWRRQLPLNYLPTPFLTSDSSKLGHLLVDSKSRLDFTNNLNWSLFRSRSMAFTMLSEPTFPSFIPQRFCKGWFLLVTEL